MTGYMYSVYHKNFEKIDTTLHYAMVKQSNVKSAHRKYIG